MKSHFQKQSILTITLIIIGVSFSLYSCEKDKIDKIDTKEAEINDNYYVKYVVRGNGTYGRFSNWKASTPQGVYTNNGNQVRSWNQTYGPVKRGFKCEVQIDDYIGGTPTIEIHVSKNEEPFALKESKIGDSALYTINF